MKKFLNTVAQDVLHKHGNDLSEVLILFPNHRSIQYFTHELMLLADKPIISPTLNTLQQYIISFSDLEVADETELLCTLYQSYRNIGGDKTIENFLGFADTILVDFDELDTQLVNPELFFKNLQQLQSMKTYQPGEEPSEFALEYRKFWQEFITLYPEFTKQLLAKGKGYRGLLVRKVAEEVKAGKHDCPHRQVYLVGFSGLNNCDVQFIDWLKQTTKTDFYNDADTFYVNNVAHEAGYLFRKHKSVLQLDDSKLVNDLVQRKREIDVIGAPKLFSQVSAAVDYLSNQWNLPEQECSNTVIVVPDEKLLPILIHQLPARYSELNISMGLPVEQSTTYRLIDAVLQLALNAGTSTSDLKSKQYYYKDVFRLLKIDLVHEGFVEESASKFEQEVRTTNTLYITDEQLVKYLGASFDKLLFKGADCKEIADYLGLLLDEAINIYKDKHHAGFQQAAMELEVCVAISDLIKGTREWVQQEHEWPLQLYARFLTQRIKTIRIPFTGNLSSGLQIMGLQETRALTFKNVIILSANEGTVPSAKFENSFIPYELRIAFGLNTHTERDAVSAYLFYRLLQGAERVAIIYNTETDQLGGGEMSRFALQLKNELNDTNSQTTISFRTLQSPVRITNTGNEISISKSPEIMKKQLHLLTQAGISPSAINTYIHCTLQYYFRYIVSIKEQDEVEETPDAAAIGEAVHHALEKIIIPFVGRVLSSDHLKSVLADKEQVEILVREKLTERFSADSLTKGKNLLLFKVCVKLVTEFLRSEVQFLYNCERQNQPLQFEALEKKLEGKLKVDNVDVLLNGRIDRIHRHGNSVYIADYKTGAYNPIPKLTDDIWPELKTEVKYAKIVQLLMYSWLYRKCNADNKSHIYPGIYWLQSQDKELDILITGNDNGGVDTRDLQQFEHMMADVFREMMNSEVPYTQTQHTDRCIYCDFKNICGREAVAKKYY